MTTSLTAEGVTVIRADDGKWLVKDGAYSNTHIYLGIADSASNWVETAEQPAEQPTAPTEETLEDELLAAALEDING